MAIETEMGQEEWFEYGWKRGWVGPPVCYTHDGLPISEDEMEEWGDGGDPCIHILRIYETQEHRLSIEFADAPTNWRASNRGWER